MAKTANADKLNGKAILVRICHSFAPSSMAASRTSAGIVEKKLRINKLHIGIPNAVWTRKIGQSVSIRPRLLNSRNSGINITESDSLANPAETSNGNGKSKINPNVDSQEINAIISNPCPECPANLIFEEGCLNCHQWGYSKCG